VQREVAEETSLKIEIVDLAGWREVVPTAEGGGHYVILSFAAHWRAGDVVLNEELDDHQWIAPETVGEFATTPGLQDIIQSARRVLGL
jgi:ADP-ribose pyrophosphatase YjhB (NUDIX family)